MVRALFYLVLGAVLVTSGVGCSRTSGRTVNVNEFEYYGEDEFAALSNSQKRAYCDNLESKRNELQGSLGQKRDELDVTRKQVESLRNQIRPVDKDILRVESDIRSLTAQIAFFEKMPGTYEVVAGDCLSIIAEKDDIYADWTKWPRIYRANLDKIEDPVWIYPGMTLAIPRDLPGEHQVAPYETLKIIAGYWEVYGDPSQWIRLYEANRDKVTDPTRLEPDIVLTIPR